MWFTVNSLNPNPGKFQYMIFGKCVANQLSLFIDGIKIERTSEVVLQGITMDDQLTFKTHIEYICRMAKYKLRALQRIRNYLSTEKARLLATAFINSQFSYAPLSWMFANIKSTKKIILGHCKWFTIHIKKSYDELLISNRDISIHQKHLHFLFCFFKKLEIGLTYVTSFYSEHICTRCYYLYSLTLSGISWYLLVCKLEQTNFEEHLRTTASHVEVWFSRVK